MTEQNRRTFNVWAISDSHVGTDLKFERRSLAEAIRQSEVGGSDGGPPFDWNIAVNLGDFSGSQTPPSDQEGEEVVRQYSMSSKHPREDFYDIVGNHDASGYDEPTQWWFRKWIDPTGESTQHSRVNAARRPFMVHGTWERYSFTAGNILFLMMGDRNDGGPPIGRGAVGGYPAGAVSLETFEWWKEKVNEAEDSIVISAHHHMLKETTVGSGAWEGVDGGYHGRMEDGAPIGASYLHFVGGIADSGLFENYLASHPGSLDIWLGGHTHTHPDDTVNGRSHVETKWNTHFVNVAALSRHHARHTIPMSRLLTFTEGSRLVKLRCYLHTSDYAPQGWLVRSERTLTISRPFLAPTL